MGGYDFLNTFVVIVSFLLFLCLTIFSSPCSSDIGVATSTSGEVKWYQFNLDSIAFPALSTGIFGFPKPLAAQVILSTILDYLAHNPASKPNLVRVVLFDEDTVQAFVEVWEQDDYFGS